MPLLLLWHPRVQGGVNPPTPTPSAAVSDYGAPGAGGARYPQEQIRRRRQREELEDDEALILAVVISIIERRH